LDSLYQTLKDLGGFLYAHPKFSFFWSLSGIQLDYYNKKHREFISLLSQLAERKQSEVLGGGYFEPMLPIVLAVDRTGQIEEFTTIQRRLIGKRPRGMWMSRMWDTKIIDSLKNCGIDYVMLDSELLGAKTFSPFILENTGKTLYALPVFQNLVPDSSPSEYLEKASEFARTADGASIVVVMLSPERVRALLDRNWFEEFFALCAARGAGIITPSRYFKETVPFVREFIPPAMKDGTNIYDYLQQRPPVHLLYSRMINVSVLVNQCRGDKAKKDAAREKLWTAQSGTAYHTEQPFKNILRARENAFRNLIHAEKIAREVTGFCDSLVSFDADFDGANEYVCRFDAYNAFITKNGGSVYELDVFKSCANYADARLERDFFAASASALPIPKNIFVDHIVENRDRLASLESDVLFASARYSEVSFGAKRREIKLAAQENFGPKNQAVSLMKNYLASEYGLQVQYIVKNRSDEPLDAILAVEFSLSFPPTGDGEFEILADNENHKFAAASRYERERGVSHAIFHDDKNLVSFMFETNEDAGFGYAPIRYSDGDAEIPYALSGVFWWKVDLMPNMETEKTINLNIVTPRKKQKAKKQP
jgi:hypothetical protein